MLTKELLANKIHSLKHELHDSIHISQLEIIEYVNKIEVLQELQDEIICAEQKYLRGGK